MAKSDNLLAILWQLQQRRKMTAAELADELELSVRTVYRYIDALCASGVPIIAEAGHEGGYRLAPSFRHAPLFFDLEERAALVHASLFAEKAGYPFTEALDRALRKINHAATAEQMEDLSLHTAGFSVIGGLHEGPQTAVLQELERAVAHGRTVVIRHIKSTDEAPVERRVDPYGIVHWRDYWYLVAYCHLRKALRSFRIDRVQSVEIAEDTFVRPDGFSAEEYLVEALVPSLTDDGEPTLVRVEGRREAIDGLCRHWYMGRYLVDRDVELATFRIDAHALVHYVPYILLSFGRSIRVTNPPALREQLVTLARELLNFYES